MKAFIDAVSDTVAPPYRLHGSYADLGGRLARRIEEETQKPDPDTRLIRLLTDCVRGLGEALQTTDEILQNLP